METAKGGGKWFIPKNNPYAVLLKEDAFEDFQRKIKERPDIGVVFLVTDSVEAFREMAGRVDSQRRCVQLYKSYLDNFKINLEGRL